MRAAVIAASRSQSLACPASLRDSTVILRSTCTSARSSGLGVSRKDSRVAALPPGGPALIAPRAASKSETHLEAWW
ncbi:hypothetical protein AcidC75_12790 [Acidisoma sp. C75]